MSVMKIREFRKQSKMPKRKEEAAAEEAAAKAQREAAEHRYKHPDHVNLEALEMLTHTDAYCPEASGYSKGYNKMKQPIPGFRITDPSRYSVFTKMNFRGMAEGPEFIRSAFIWPSHR